MNYPRSLTDFFRSPAWMKNFLLGGVAILIPIIGPLVLNGWHISLFWMKLKQEPENYPPFRLDDIGKYLERSVWPFLVSLIVGLVIMLPVMACFFLLMFSTVAMAEAKGGSPPGSLFPMLFVVQLIGGAFYYLVGTPFLIRATMLQKFDGVFDFRFAQDFLVRMWREMLRAILFFVAMWIVLSIAGMALCFVGVYLTVPLGLFAMHHIQRQLYENYLSKGGREIPTSPKLTGEPPSLPT